MRYSIRGILLTTLLAAVAMMAWKWAQQAHQDRVRVAQTLVEIKRAEQQIAARQLKDVDLKRETELHETVAAARAKAEARFEQIQQKYFELAPVDEETFSIRSIPTLSSKSENMTAFRIFAPQQRDVYLKFGSHLPEHKDHWDRKFDDDKAFLKNAALNHPAPYQMRLPAGLHVLRIRIQDTVGPFQLRLDLNDQTVFSTSYVKNDYSGNNRTSTNISKQLNLKANRSLPWLMTIKMRVADSQGQSVDSKRFLSIWLSDRKSEFEDFPSHE